MGGPAKDHDLVQRFASKIRNRDRATKARVCPRMDSSFADRARRNVVGLPAEAEE
jgi:hypothetical protein